jgi:pyruvate formate lyase activating enzyme
MRLNLGDIIPTSTLDWPGKVVLVVFTWGCPLRCPYCSNARFIDVPEGEPDAEAETVKARILEAADFIDGVVFSGGEPFMQPAALKELASYVKGLGLLVGAHTNGVYPERIRELAEAGLLDGVFLDLKAPLEYERYVTAAGPMEVSVLDAVRRSLLLCCELRRQNKIGTLEVRTTVLRNISDKPEDIKDIVDSIECADAYVIQQGRPEIALDERVRNTEAVPRNELVELAVVARKNAKSVNTVKVRTHVFGDETIK